MHPLHAVFLNAVYLLLLTLKPSVVLGFRPYHAWKAASSPCLSLRQQSFVHASHAKTGITTGSIAPKIATISKDVASRSNSRRRMGPPQRKLNYRDEDKLTGRVSVYCVGSEIDLEALRAHVFRRGFGGKSGPELTLSRRTTAGPDLDEEVLHVSNAPLFIASDNSRSLSAWKDPDQAWADDAEAMKRSRIMNKKSEQQVSAPVDDNALAHLSLAVQKDDPTIVPHPPIEYAENSNEGRVMVDTSTPANSGDLDKMSWQTKEMLVMTTQDIFYFDYGCVVCWGLSPSEEKAVLTELQAFTVDPVSPVELENSFDTMEFTFDRAANPQRPIKFDRMKLRSLRTEEKLALSYAMAQSSKLFVFEFKVLQSVERTRYLPKELAQKGKISCSKKDLNSLIGQLFVEQTEVNLFSSILDTPDFLWDDDEYFPTYEYCRSYLEVDDRVQLLNSRLAVIRELLDVLTAQVADNNSTRLEWIIIWLIAIEIVMGIASSPLFVGKRVVTALLVPTAILLYRKIDWGLEK